MVEKIQYPGLSDPSLQHCVRFNSGNQKYLDFACLFPTFGKTYLPFELNYDPVGPRDWMKDNFWVPVACAIIYAIAIFWGRSYFEKRAAWNWRAPLALWNFGLSLFSTIGFLRVAPFVLFNIYSYTLRENCCFDPESHVGSGATGFWSQMFVLSKIPELFDTFFIVIHKKPLMFLHWYHHISVLLFTWHAYVNNSPTGAFFISMNYGVHAMMYFYYFLMAVRMKPKWFNPIWITVAQISQMFVGVFLTVYTTYILHVEEREDCLMRKDINQSALVMYGSYLFLFCKFFFERYYIRGKPSKTSKKVN
ncbi:elongation of very long chain fatty acids protein 6 [Fistulifera solaris]|uniref:Elongation of fatty acids protein n=1 Tax=Fistulifera solaris TaxID=1519565 RepID=A0A1Z5K0F2_FISSO|nr:elongation of very long chain fatty acids protein 6 [Fistulifera solaris]|eukprot:GAX19602.1 elongation of very long chain fatty acids protein 6 [Fistulifera solaris]